MLFCGVLCTFEPVKMTFPFENILYIELERILSLHYISESFFFRKGDGKKKHTIIGRS